MVEYNDELHLKQVVLLHETQPTTWQFIQEEIFEVVLVYKYFPSPHEFWQELFADIKAYPLVQLWQFVADKQVAHPTRQITHILELFA